MNRHWGEMSAVQSVHFDRATHTLRVAFEDGAVYDFADVPEHVYDDLARSPAPDAFFHENVRDEYIATRVGDVDLAEMAHERREDAILGPPLAEQLHAPASDADAGDRPRDVMDVRRSHHTWVVDVIDDDSAAVHVDGRQITPLPRWLLPADAREGDVLRVTHSRGARRSTVAIEIDRDATRLAYDRSAAQSRDAPPGGTGDVNL